MSGRSFVKMNGWGNDFVVFEGPLAMRSDDVRAICDRRFGVGADGVLVVTSGPPILMEYWNADGSGAEMCGNGLRCVARFARDRGMVDVDHFEIETPVGILGAEIDEDDIVVELGRARIVGDEEIDGHDYHLVDVGNPHAVRSVDSVDDIDVALIGPRVEADERFANGTNVEFIRVDNGAVEMRVWERGVGETLACGSGMVAAAVVAVETDSLGPEIRVTVPGGSGVVEARGDVYWLRGPVNYSFEGVWDPQG